MVLKMDGFGIRYCSILYERLNYVIIIRMKRRIKMFQFINVPKCCKKCKKLYHKYYGLYCKRNICFPTKKQTCKRQVKI